MFVHKEKIKMAELKDRRCLYCNWLNKEVGEYFICKNCNNSNQIIPLKNNIVQKIKLDLIK